ncbi:MAG: hypothetical protein ABL886_11560 [Rhodoglobus sp.]
MAPPGPLAEWSSALLTKAAERARVPISHIDRTDTISAPGAPAIFLCQFPSLSAIASVMQGTLNPVCIVADPQWTVAVQRARGANLLEALRYATASTTANLAIGRTSRSRLVYPEMEHTTETAAHRLLVACGLPADSDALHDTLSGLGMTGDTRFLSTLSQFYDHAEPSPLTPSDSATTRSVLSGVAAMAEGQTDAPIVWPTAVFLSGDQPNSQAPTISVVAGPSRVVLYGPYLHLPPATYRGEITIVFSGRIEEIAFQLDFFAGQTQITSLRMEGRKSGAYRGRFNLVIEDPVPHIEIHLRNERGSIEGEVALQELRFYIDEADARSFS